LGLKVKIRVKLFQNNVFLVIRVKLFQNNVFLVKILSLEVERILLKIFVGTYYVMIMHG